MKSTFKLLAIGAAFMLPAAAQAQMTPPPSNTETPDAQTAPDGSDAFGFEPYVAVMGGYFNYDRDVTNIGIPNRVDGRNREGALVEGIVGANIPLGAIFVGAEGNVAKGVDGSIDWQYGVTGRVGFRAGESGLVYARPSATRFRSAD